MTGMYLYVSYILVCISTVEDKTRELTSWSLPFSCSSWLSMDKDFHLACTGTIIFYRHHAGLWCYSHPDIVDYFQIHLPHICVCCIFIHMSFIYRTIRVCMVLIAYSTHSIIMVLLCWKCLQSSHCVKASLLLFLSNTGTVDFQSRWPLG